jgi:hypothetical protein
VDARERFSLVFPSIDRILHGIGLFPFIVLLSLRQRVLWESGKRASQRFPLFKQGGSSSFCFVSRFQKV